MMKAWKAWAVAGLMLPASIFIMIGGLMLLERNRSSGTTGLAVGNSCNYASTSKAIETMKELAIIYRVESEAGSPSVYVMGDWYEFPFEGKRLLDSNIRCRSGGAFDRSVYVHYYDYRSGKSVAISSSGGLTIY
jgi:hypothetical protein